MIKRWRMMFFTITAIALAAGGVAFADSESYAPVEGFLTVPPQCSFSEMTSNTGGGGTNYEDYWFECNMPSGEVSYCSVTLINNGAAGYAVGGAGLDYCRDVFNEASEGEVVVGQDKVFFCVPNSFSADEKYGLTVTFYSATDISDRGTWTAEETVVGSCEDYGYPIYYPDGGAGEYMYTTDTDIETRLNKIKTDQPGVINDLYYDGQDIITEEELYGGGNSGGNECANILPEEWCDAEGGDGIIQALRLALTILTGGVGILATIGIVVSGIQYINSSGDSAKMTKAKSRILNIVIGLLAYGVMWIALEWLIPGGLISSSGSSSTDSSQGSQSNYVPNPNGIGGREDTQE